MNRNKPGRRSILKHVKTVFFLSGCLMVVHTAIAQKKVERFCRVDVWWRSEHKQLLTISYGSKQDFVGLTDTAALSKLDYVKNFTNEVDAINYMNDLGWSLDKIVGLSQLNYLCYFRKIYETDK